MASASLTQTLDDVTLDARAFGPNKASVVQTLDPVVGVSTVGLGRVLTFRDSLGQVTLSATATLGPAPSFIQLQARIYNLTGPVRVASGAILCFVGPPNKTVSWRIVKGHATLTPYTTFTDDRGRCSCRLDAAGFAETVIVGAAYVP